MKKSLTKKVSHNIEKILIKVSQKGEKIAYLHKSVILIFLLHLEFHQNFKNHHAKKLNKTYFVNIFSINLDNACILNGHSFFNLKKKTESKLHVPKPFVFSNKNENKK